MMVSDVIFLSTLSLRRATQALSVTGSESQFLSTLSLRRATFPRDCYLSADRHFYPRSPCGERQCPKTAKLVLFKFLSTLSLRRATGIQSGAQQATAISIHALLAESDIPEKHERPLKNISIHALLAESDKGRHRRYNRNAISIHALLAESDIITVCVGVATTISIHALLAESD